jgi:hypothetical protein
MLLLPPIIQLLCTITSTLTQETFQRFDTPKLYKTDWDRIDDELKMKLRPFNYHLGKVTNSKDIATLGDQIGYTIGKFLASKPELFEEKKQKSKLMQHL